ncbi:hypothetical protein PMIT1327_01947 [Prochlorococcus marinus str. MIT 1327]|nr:hypothetical protein PMIT1312_02700 [Prochlorococcus marinus str. MIT 1312]KZR79884.1 hypothetical protein PMIT1327_01947 [Prochlorococcus marinus str. MIT 1327]
MHVFDLSVFELIDGIETGHCFLKKVETTYG